MIALICLFLPAVFALWLFEHIRKTALTRRQWFYRYCTNVLFINLATFAFRLFVLDKGYSPFGTLLDDFSCVDGMHYLIVAVPVAIILAFLQILFSKHATVCVEEQKDA